MPHLHHLSVMHLCNFLCKGSSNFTFPRLQMLQNTVGAHKRQHVAPVLAQFLPPKHRVDFKWFSFGFKALQVGPLLFLSPGSAVVCHPT